jgi:hypothetical protein
MASKQQQTGMQGVYLVAAEFASRIHYLTHVSKPHGGRSLGD